MIVTTTQDGTVILSDPRVGEITARSREEAEAELRRRLANGQRRAA